MYKKPIYSILKFEEHALQRGDMWRGSSIPSKLTIWKYNKNIFTSKNIFISEAILKCIDEIIVNAVDHYFESINAPKEYGGPTTEIKINYEKDIISVYNDGPGFPIKKMGDKYLPEILMTKEFSTSHANDDKDPYRVTGGLNGVGLKICVISSKEFYIETIDKKRNLIYKQKILDNMKKIEEPEISSSYDKSYTLFKFQLDYEKLCNSTFSISDLIDWIEYRAREVAVFIGSIDKSKCGYNQYLLYPQKAKVYFNNQLMSSNFENFCKFFPSDERKFLNIEGDYPCKLCFLISQEKKSITLVNGIHLEKAPHVDILYKEIESKLKDKIEKNFSISKKMFSSLLQRYLSIISCRQYPLPAFDGQRKTSVKTSLTFKQNYNLDPIINSLWDPLKKYFISDLEKKKTKKKKFNDVRKYIPARYAGKKPGCYLIIPEGDSAALPMLKIIRTKGLPLNSDYGGLYNMQGVPMNVIKNSQEVDNHIQQSRRLKENIAFQGLVSVLNLDFKHSYYYGKDPQKRKEGDEQFEKLNYQYIIIATDQDLDGIGHICSLILIFFLYFFPELIKRNFVRRINTPIKRVIIGKKKKNFYSESQYQSWLQTTYDGKLPPSCRVHYYKGLGEHSVEDIIKDIGAHIEKNILTFVLDKNAISTMHSMYGKDSSVRKEILTTPVNIEYDQKFKSQLLVKCSDHFNIETKSMQLKTLDQRLKSAIDGFVEAQRKAFAGRRTIDTKKQLKVYQLTGIVTANMHYVHGDSCMNDTIIKMAQTFPGSNNIPVFIPISAGFGDRNKGRGITSSPRYLDIGYNKAMDLLYPPEDDYLLDYVFDNGERCEPKYYIPIMPYSILENTTSVAAGWKINVWARDFDIVYKSLINMINNDGTIYCKPFLLFGNPWLREGMYVKIIPYQEICYGTYQYIPNSNTIHITQLPLKLWSFDLICKILHIDKKTGIEKGNEYVKSIIDNTTTDVDIKIKLKSEAYDIICKKYGDELFDPIESYFGLYTRMTPHLNMVFK
ncbi:MAG: DNA gyrase subunit A, partial [Nitrososphaerota archaeon]